MLFAIYTNMTDEYPIRFTLIDGTEVIVKKVTNNKYDFELMLLNGNRKTFLWAFDMPDLLKNIKGKTDQLAFDAVTMFRAVLINPL